MTLGLVAARWRIGALPGRQHRHPADDAEVVLGDLGWNVVEPRRLQPEALDELHHAPGAVVAGDVLLPRLGGDLVEREALRRPDRVLRRSRVGATVVFLDDRGRRRLQ